MKTISISVPDSLAQDLERFNLSVFARMTESELSQLLDFSYKFFKSFAMAVAAAEKEDD